MSVWTDHGTKVLGYSAAAVGTAAASVLAVDPALIAAVVSPKYAPFIALAFALFGGAVAKRGHTNTTNAENPPTP